MLHSAKGESSTHEVRPRVRPVPWLCMGSVGSRLDGLPKFPLPMHPTIKATIEGPNTYQHTNSISSSPCEELGRVLMSHSRVLLRVPGDTACDSSN